ncbi:MAG TPA: catecholate siderophore receptor Fiu [Stenotrophomonas sp.]|jgi:catecholate siderophore receptor
MSIKSRKHSLARVASAHTLTAAALLMAAPLAHAEAPAADAKTLDKVDVHAERAKRYLVEQSSSDKFTQSLLDTPQTLNIISKDLFNEQGATTLTEALRNSPGVGTFFVGENGNTTTGDTIYMRGFDTSSSIFVDGVRDLGSISRDVFNIEQIEVAKGPAGTDNGRSAPTGAINLVTKQPLGTDEVSAAITGGVDGQRRVTADWNQTLGSPAAAFRLNVMGQDSDAVGRDHVQNKRWGVAPSLAFGLDGDTRYYIDLLYVKQDNLPDGSVPTLGLPGYTSPDPARPWLATVPKVDPENFYGTRHDHDDVTSKMATFRFEHDFSDTLRLTNTARWGRNEQEYMLTAFMVTAANLLTPNLADPSTWTLARSTPTFKDQEYTILTDQLNLRWNFMTGAVEHDLSTGLEATREELENWGVGTRGAWPAANLYDPDWNVDGLSWSRNGAHSDGRTTTYSFYAFDTLKFGENLLVTGGVRVDHYDTDFSSLVVCGARGGPVCGALPTGSIVPGVDADSSDTLFNWKLGAVYKATEQVSVYANYAISQQPPGGSALELSAAANSANNPALDPQKAETAEIGTKWNFFDANLLVTMALFRTDVTNEIAPDPTNPNIFYQTGEKQVQGVELSAVGKITDQWSVSAGYTRMDAQVKEGSNVAQDGTQDLTYTPDSAFTAWSTYTFPFKLTLGGGVRYSGEMKRGTDGAIGTPSFVKSYTVWDAVVSYPINDHFDLRLNAFNVFDKDYVAGINKSGYRYSPGAPRTFTLTANLRF